MFKIFASFDHNDWKNFNLFIRGQPGIHKDVLSLLDYISKYKKNLKSRQLNIDIAHVTLHRKKSRKSFRNIMSKLTIVTEDYIRWTWLRQDQEEYDINLLKAFNARGLYHLYDLKAEQVRNRVKKSNILDFWSDLHLLKIDHDQFFSNNPIKSIEGERLLRNLTESSLNFTSKMSLFYQGVMEYFGDITNTDFSDELEKLSNYSKFQKGDTITEILKHFVLLNQNQVPQSFRYLYHILIEDKKDFTEVLKASLLISLIHYAYAEYKSGSSNTANEILALNMFGIETGVLLVNNKITTTRFVNIVNAACACEEYDTAEIFIDRYRNLLEETLEIETVQISIAQIRFYQSRYAEVLDLLANASYQLFAHTLRMRWILLCTYFMKFRKDVNFLESMFRNYNNFIRNNKDKMSTSNYNGSLNLSKILKRIMKDPENPLVEINLKEAKNLVFRTWLRKQTKIDLTDIVI